MTHLIQHSVKKYKNNNFIEHFDLLFLLNLRLMPYSQNVRYIYTRDTIFELSWCVKKTFFMKKIINFCLLMMNRCVKIDILYADSIRIALA